MYGKDAMQSKTTQSDTDMQGRYEEREENQPRIKERLKWNDAKKWRKEYGIQRRKDKELFTIDIGAGKKRKCSLSQKSQDKSFMLY